MRSSLIPATAENISGGLGVMLGTVGMEMDTRNEPDVKGSPEILQHHYYAQTTLTPNN